MSRKDIIYTLFWKIISYAEGRLKGKGRRSKGALTIAMREAAEGDRQCLSLGITVEEEVPEFYMSLKSKNWSESPWSFRGTLKTTQGYGCVGRTPAALLWKVKVLGRSDLQQICQVDNHSYESGL